MKVTNLLFSIVVFSMVVMAFTGMWLDAAQWYDKEGEIEEMAFVKGTVTAINSTMRTMQQQFKEESVNPANYNPLMAPFTAANFLFGVMDLGRNMLTDAISINESSGGFPVPDWFQAGVITIFMIVVVMGLLAAFLKYKP